MNDALQATSDDARVGEERASAVTHFLEAVLGSLPSGVLTVDPQWQVTAWNAASEDLWGLRADEVVGRRLAELDFGLPLEGVTDTVRTVLDRPEHGLHELRLDAVNRRGRAVRLRIVVSPLQSRDGAGGALLVTEPLPGDDDGGGPDGVQRVGPRAP